MQSAVYHDFEEFAASLQNVDARIMLTHDLGQRWKTHTARLNRLSIRYGLEGGGIICEGATRPNCVVVFVPMQNAAAIITNGQLCDDRCWMLQTPDREFCFAVSAPNEWVSVSIPVDVWSQFAEGIGRIQANELVRSSPALVARFREVIRRFLAISHGHSRFLEIPSIVESIEAELLSALRSMVMAEEKRTTISTGRPVIPRDEVVRSAKILLDESSNKDLPAGSLAAAAGVSERTMRNVFHDYYGVAPLRYLRLRRLHLVRSALKQADPRRHTVTDVVKQFGIWELGRFAQAYRRLFGETPSQTLLAATAHSFRPEQRRVS
jgi:AraC family transcriptional regulator, ethanolamine operon transcriptional activator